MLKKLIPIGLILIVLVAGFLIFGKKVPQGPQGPAKTANAAASDTLMKVSVKAKTADTVENVSNLSYESSLEASEEAIITSKVSGKVSEVLFEDGKAVKQGDTLVKMDDQDIRNNLKAAESQLAAAQAGLENMELNLENAQRDYDRKKNLFDQKAIAQSDLENAQSALKSAEANITTTKANIQTSQVNVENIKDSLQNTIITAVTTGVIDSKSVNLGQYLNPGSVLGKINKISPIYAIIKVEQNDLDYVKPGQNVQVKVGTENPKTYEGVIHSIDASADSSTRTFKCRVQIDNSDLALKPGIYAKVEISKNQKIQVLAVPMQALTGTQGNYSVFTVDNGTAKKHSVVIGDISKGMVEIKSGIQKGDKVILTNVNTLQDGDKITVVSE